MAYVRPTDPLPRNSEDPMTACEIRRAKAIVDGMSQSVRNAQWASAQIAPPSSFRSFGPAVELDVARSQNDMMAARLTQEPKPVGQAVNTQAEILAAPTVLPLNVTDAEYNGCSVRSSRTLQPIRIAPQVVTMPARAPEPVNALPQVARQPKYGNLCWGLHMGLIAQRQFTPDDLRKLYMRCAEQGYVGGCAPPPEVVLWLAQKDLPMIPVSDADIASIPKVDLTGSNCSTRVAMAGMSGYRRGLGAAWGDAGTLPSTDSWSVQSNTPVDWKKWLLFGAVGVGLFMMAGQNGRR